MHIVDEPRDDVIEDLILKIERVFRADKTLTHPEVLTALMITVGGALMTIRCPGCRAFAMRYVRSVATDFEAQDASNNAEPSPSSYVH